MRLPAHFLILRLHLALGAVGTGNRVLCTRAPEQCFQCFEVVTVVRCLDDLKSALHFVGVFLDAVFQRVAEQEQTETVIRHLGDERRVVRVRVRQPREVCRQDACGTAVRERERARFGQARHGHPRAVKSGGQRRVRLARRRKVREQNLSHLERIEEGGGAADMILVKVREDQIIDAALSLSLQYPLHRRITLLIARIHQHGRVGGIQKDRIRFPDIHEHAGQIPHGGFLPAGDGGTGQDQQQYDGKQSEPMPSESHTPAITG